jgi:hypothetical protein
MYYLLVRWRRRRYTRPTREVYHGIYLLMKSPSSRRVRRQLQRNGTANYPVQMASKLMLKAKNYAKCFDPCEVSAGKQFGKL